MKIVILNGSARMKGNTRTALKAIESGIDTAAHEVEFIDVTKYKMSGCMGCDGCKKTGGICVIKDECIEIVEKAAGADMIIFGSPVYWWGISAQLKTVIDRMYMKNETLGNTKKKIGVLAVGADELSGEQYDLISRQFKCICEYLGWELVFDQSISAAAIGDMEKQSEKMEELKDIGKAL